MRTYRLVIGSAEAGLRLDHYLARRLPAALSRSAIQRSIRDGQVTVGDRPVKVHYKLHPQDVVVARLAELPAQGGDTVLIPQDIPLDLVYEDAHLFVVNKPAGLVTHPAPGHWTGTLVNALLWHLQAPGSRLQAEGDRLEPRASSLELPLPRAGIVHRLDKDTSGLLLVAKSAAAHTALAKQLKARTIRRRYLALIDGHVPLDQGTVNAPIGRHQTHRKQMTVRALGGRQAVTHYRVLKRYPAQGSKLKAEGDRLEPRASSLEPPPFPYSLLELTLDTGRTHQIRVHLAHLGYPVIGDATYGKRPASFWRELSINRQLLHAWRLQFRHPVSRQELTCTAEVPDDLARWIDEETLQQLQDASSER